MTARPPNHPHDTLQIHCRLCGLFLQAWTRSQEWPFSEQPPLPTKTGKGVRVRYAQENGEQRGAGPGVFRVVLLHRCRAHNGCELETVVRAAKLVKHLDAKERRVDW